MDNKSIFLVFDDIIKTPSLAVLKALLNPKMKQNFSEIIDYTRFEFMNDDNLLRLCIQRSDKNILRYLGLVEGFDYDKMYSLIHDNIEDRFTPCPSLKMVNAIAIAMSTPQIGNVYIYSEKFDEQIETHIGAIFNSNRNKLRYVYGDIAKAVSGKDITLFILPDLDYVNTLEELGCLKGKEVLVPNYGYNFTLDDEGHLVFKYDILKSIESDNLYKLRTYAPFDLTQKHMSQMMNNVDENNNLSLG